jgi:hypothetical protein
LLKGKVSKLVKATHLLLHVLIHSAVRKPSKTNLNKLRWHKTPSPQTTLSHRLQHFALLASVLPGAPSHQTIPGLPAKNYPG